MLVEAGKKKSGAEKSFKVVPNFKGGPTDNFSRGGERDWILGGIKCWTKIFLDKGFGYESREL